MAASFLECGGGQVPRGRGFKLEGPRLFLE